jgi:alkylhydroperoxidase family enzyme
MSDTARIPLEHRNTPLVRLASWWSRRAYGDVLEPGLAMLHNRKVLMANVTNERRVAKWDALDNTLKALAVMAAAAAVECSWCMDFGYWMSYNEGVDPRKLEDVPRWRSSDAYTDVERLVMAYAEAMTATPLEVTDEMVAELREQLTDAALVELTAMVALENQRSRVNSALGLTSQGFKAQCELRPSAAGRPAAVREAG